MEVVRNSRRTLTGVVTSDKMDKTRVVEIQTFKKHPLYGKRMKHNKKYKMHDEKNESKEGDIVKMRETRKISKDKYFMLIDIKSSSEVRVKRDDPQTIVNTLVPQTKVKKPIVAKPAPVKAVAKPVVKKVAAPIKVAVKPAAKKVAAKPVAKPAVKKVAAKKPAVKKVAAKKPAVKKAAVKPAAKKTTATTKKPAAKAATKKVAAKPAAKAATKKVAAKPATKKPVAKKATKK
jgi:ribosomal protein uS17